MTSEQAAPVQPGAPRCYRHPERETWVSCTRCERPICPDCLRPAAVGFQCPQCVAEGQTATRQARTQYGGRLAERAGLVTSVLAVLNIGAFVVTAVTSPGGLSRNTASQLYDRLVLFPPLVAVNHEYWRMIGAAFLHNGLLHITFNMIALAVVGPPLERAFGMWRYLTLYLLAALGGSVSVYLFQDPNTAVAGASGAIFGLFAAYVVVARHQRLDLRPMLGTIVLNFAISFAPGISLFGHLGGFVVGGLAALALVYIPRGPNRTSLQILAFGGLLAIMVALTLYRTNVLAGIYG